MRSKILKITKQPSLKLIKFKPKNALKKFLEKIMMYFRFYAFVSCESYEVDYTINHQFLFINPYLRILEKNPKRGIVTERFCGKKSRAQRCIIYICSCALEFFPESALGDGPKNGIYFRSARHISVHIGICHFKLGS